MTPALYPSSANLDLAGDWSPNLRSGKIEQQIQALIDRYLTLEHLHDRLQDLPRQFEHPQVRSWPPLDWKGSCAQQVVGIKREVFLAIGNFPKCPLLRVINTMGEAANLG
jgi:hypothetical protein